MIYEYYCPKCGKLFCSYDPDTALCPVCLSSGVRELTS